MDRQPARTLELSTPLTRARAWLGMLAFGLPVALVACTLAMSGRIEPALANPVTTWVLAFVVASSGVVWWWLARRIARVGVSLDRGQLHVDGGFGRGSFDLAGLAANGMREIEYTKLGDLRPVLRTWGIGMPGLSSGWFRLRNGDKALCILTERRKPCVLQARDGTRILLSLADPGALRAALERHSRA
ncbi:MAG TPA: PH domain-containing protein [Dokdonella sp.]